MKRNSSPTRTSAIAVALAAVAFGSMSSTAQQPGSRPSPLDDDGTALVLPRTPDALQTLSFLLGQVDLSTLGVSDAELATVGPTAPTASTSGDHMLIVDDGADCPNAEYPTIQSAVAAATPGDKIKVCRGTYVEQVTIPPGKDDLVLFSEGAWQAVVKAPPVMVDPKAIIHVNGARNVTIRHFTIAGPGGGPCDSIRWGVRVDNGGSATITDNHITDIRDTPFSGCQNGIGVLIGRNFENQTASAVVVHNLIDRYQKGGVVVDGTVANGPSRAEVAYNEVVGSGVTQIIAQNGIQISRNAIATVHHNRISLNNFGPLSTVSEGIILFQEHPDTIVDHNYSFLNDDGVGLFGSRGTEVSHNRLERNDFDGIYAGSDTKGNTIAYNHAEENVEHDCHDDSVGPGTAGTANFWIKDLGDTENRPGLCKSRP